ncbi:uncharacterized protein LOC100204650 [Hydra vulgaris]|uniref:uncharacterized protein LOC100204650 n=1 Tax=Hydra vulgaris TaxID=6087 RepID=UPI0001923E38|nr:protein PRY1 [Hydra vulgaris]
MRAFLFEKGAEMYTTSFVSLFFVLQVSGQNTNVVLIKNQDVECLNKHNGLRSLHQDTGNLELDATVTASAQKHAEYLASTGTFTHSKNSPYGENLYMISGGPAEGVCVKASTSWYNEISKYNFKKPGFSMNTGHFTQVVWKESKKVGFGIAKHKNGKVIVVAQYLPRGNMMGAFPKNVLPLKQ